MSEETLYESERTQSRTAIASTLRRVAEAFDSGDPAPIDDDGTVTVELPAESAFEVELEREDDELSLEFEIEWTVGEADVETDTRDSDGKTPAGTDEIAAEGSKATFELYRDRADEWRWRLRHQNGNVIADSGEGYGKKTTARNGIESVKTNAAGAVVEEQD
ncbi:hypothetical protein BRD19_01250 [Halobacteriales archaeon SW_7_65_23]|jgi:amphi-Trp domain-containing protein|nr:MAG: hypothetical protein BRD19_01250 [Halobacteriales archaeon SW_7_65_23]